MPFVNLPQELRGVNVRRRTMRRPSYGESCAGRPRHGRAPFASAPSCSLERVVRVPDLGFGGESGGQFGLVGGAPGWLAVRQAAGLPRLGGLPHPTFVRDTPDRLDADRRDVADLDEVVAQLGRRPAGERPARSSVSFDSATVARRSALPDPSPRRPPPPQPHAWGDSLPDRSSAPTATANSGRGRFGQGVRGFLAWVSLRSRCAFPAPLELSRIRHRPRPPRSATAGHDRRPRPQATTAGHDRRPRPPATRRGGG
ncbi:hypothetical protein C5N14_21025 [Micromonospora sp. MW-13]|nr:hypothetical protein C5N14_21025 [Micromonospora sp. MW-13]